MKKNLLLIAGLFFVTSLMAAPVTRGQAARKAAKFFNLPARQFASAASNVKSEEIRPYYLFNNGADNGYVIISGDDRTAPVLGYSDRGTISEDNMPDNMRAWLKGYEREIKQLQESGYEAAGSKRPVKRTIEALIKTQWDQSHPYNDLCPMFAGDEDNRPTGCVATAMAQIMKYYEWPQEASTEIPGYFYSGAPELGDYNPHQLETLPAIVFDWKNMKNVYTGSETAQEKNAVAELMQYCGHSLEMNYGIFASGTHSTFLPKALYQYFGYDKGIHLVDRDGYDAYEWEDLIYGELLAGRPVLYSGITDMFGGHQFLCDGYKDGYFHINWGWSGRSDGFFRLSVLDPAEQGVGGAVGNMAFNYMHQAVIGIQPDAGNEIAEDKPVVGYLSCVSESAIQKDTNGGIRFSYAAHLGYNAVKDGKFVIGLGLYDAQGNHLTTIDEKMITFVANFREHDKKGTAYFGKDFIKEDGTYYVRLVYAKDKTSEEFLVDGCETKYIELKVAGNDVEIVSHPQADLTVSSVELTGLPATMYGMAHMFAEITVTNNSTSNISGMFDILINGQSKRWSGMWPALGSREKYETIDAGATKKIKIEFNAEGGRNVISPCFNRIALEGEKEITIGKLFEGQANLSLTPCDGYTAEGTDLDITVNVKNNASANYNGYVTVFLLEDLGQGNYTQAGQLDIAVKLDKGESGDYVFSFKDLTPSASFAFQLYYASQGEMAMQYADTPSGMYEGYKTSAVNALRMWNANGPMTFEVPETGEINIMSGACYVAVPASYASHEFVKNDNPNCVYSLEGFDKLPAGLEGVNYIADGNVMKMDFVNGHDVYVPGRIQKDNITYTCVAEKDFMALYLPFIPGKVMCDGKELTVAANAADASADITMQQLLYEDGENIYFGYLENSELTSDNFFMIKVKEELVGKNLEFFSAEKDRWMILPEVVSADEYDICGSLSFAEINTPVYVYDGANFVKKENAKSEPFSFTLRPKTNLPAEIHVVTDDFLPSGITDIEAEKMVVVYDIYGMPVMTVDSNRMSLEGLPSGIYVAGGKKYIVK